MPTSPGRGIGRRPFGADAVVMTRRFLSLLAALALLVAAGGCAAGQDGAEAMAILDRASEAQKNLESVSFDMTMKGEAAGQSFDLTLNGGGYLKGERAGDMVVSLSLSAPGMPVAATQMQMVAVGDRAYMNLGGSWQELPGGAAAFGGGTAGAALEQQLAGFDFTRYVTDVRVEKEGSFLGEPVTKVIGTIALDDLMNGVFAQLGSGGGLAGLGPLGSSEELLQGIDVGDIRAAIYVSDVTHLVRAVHMDFAMEAQGQKATFQIDLSLRSVNEPVEIPEPAVVA